MIYGCNFGIPIKFFGCYHGVNEVPPSLKLGVFSFTKNAHRKIGIYYESRESHVTIGRSHVGL